MVDEELDPSLTKVRELILETEITEPEDSGSEDSGSEDSGSGYKKRYRRADSEKIYKEFHFRLEKI